MSYRKTYNSSITMSGTVSVNYPASEHGGTTTAHWTHTEPVAIDIMVNTDPFDNSVAAANNSINMLTGAVVGMESIQCKTISDNAEKISDRIISGFYNLVNSNVSVQKAEVATAVHSKFALLMQFSKDLLQKHTRMEADVARLRSHYAKVFDSLDEDCHKRIYQLDKGAFELNEKVHRELIDKPYRVEGSFGYSQIKDTANSENLISLARIRKKVSDVVGHMSTSVMKSLNFESTVKTMTESIAIDTNEVEYMPVVYSISQSLSDAGKLNCKCFAPDIAGRDEAINVVSNVVKSKTGSEWSNINRDEYIKLENEFVKQAESYFSNADDKGAKAERVYKMMMAMWKQNNLYTIS